MDLTTRTRGMTFPNLLVCIYLLTVLDWTMAKSFYGETVNNRPIIGIALKPSKLPYGDEFVESDYIKYLEAFGARVVPMRGNESPEYYEKLFNSINGALFPGGGADLYSSNYFKIGKFMFNKAKQAFDKGDYFPIWGTCLGSQLLGVLTAGKNLLKPTNSLNITLNLNFNPDIATSRLLQNMSKEIWNNLATKHFTQNNHQYSLLFKDFQATPELSDFLRVLTTSVDRDNKTFVSLFEAKKYPFYGSQFHPEKSLFRWHPNEDINHSFDSIKASQYFGNFFINEAKKSHHRFDSVAMEARSVVENGLNVFLPGNNFEQNFYFNFTTRQSSLRFKSEIPV